MSITGRVLSLSSSFTSHMVPIVSYILTALTASSSHDPKNGFSFTKDFMRPRISTPVQKLGSRGWEVARFDAENLIVDKGNSLSSLGWILGFPWYWSSKSDLSLDSSLSERGAGRVPLNGWSQSVVPSATVCFFNLCVLLLMTIVVSIGLTWTSTGLTGPETCRRWASILLPLAIQDDGRYSVLNESLASASARGASWPLSTYTLQDSNKQYFF